MAKLIAKPLNSVKRKHRQLAKVSSKQIKLVKIFFLYIIGLDFLPSQNKSIDIV